MKNKIKLFFRCAECSAIQPSDQSMQEFARLECGWTPKGFQVWCVRHDKNVVALDFMGQKIDYDGEEN